MKYEFKYRLSQKSSFAQIVKAARACNLKIVVEWNYIRFLSGDYSSYFSQNVLLDEVPEWLNGQLEDKGLLKPLEAEI